MKEQRKKTFAKRLLVAMLSVMMTVTCVPASLFAYATEPEVSSGDVQTDVQTEKTQEDVQTEGTQEDIQAEGTQEDVQAEGTQEDVQAGGTQEDVQAEASEDSESPEDESEKTADNKTLKATLSGGVTITAVINEDAQLPEDVTIVAKELTEETSNFDYDKHCEEALEALQEDAEDVDGIKMAKFDDISFASESAGGVVEPKAPVSVTIDYKDGLKMKDADEVGIVHFGKKKAEALDKKDNKVKTKKNADESELTGASFEADSFSVYAVVGYYTVDFSFEVDGETYDFSLPGGGYISLSELAEALKIATDEEENDAFIDAVEDVSFSSPELVSVSKVDKDTTVGKLKGSSRFFVG